MIKKEYNELDTKRILGMIEIRELTRSIIEAQLEDYSDDEIKLRQKKLNTSYGKFVEEFEGYLIRKCKTFRRRFINNAYIITRSLRFRKKL